MSLWSALKRTAGFFVDCLCSQRLYRRMDDEEFPCKQEFFLMEETLFQSVRTYRKRDQSIQ